MGWGKRWLIASGQLPMPGRFGRFVEPFLGSGAVYFSLQPRRALLSDINIELITLYEQIKAAPDILRCLMDKHQRNHSQTYYYEVRSQVSPDGYESSGSDPLFEPYMLEWPLPSEPSGSI
jgi:DNA adenine methylase